MIVSSNESIQIRNIEPNVEYEMNRLENEDAVNALTGKTVHIYNANCSCPGNNIKINEHGVILGATTVANNELMYDLKVEGRDEPIKVTTRSHFIKLKIEE